MIPNIKPPHIMPNRILNSDEIAKVDRALAEEVMGSIH